MNGTFFLKRDYFRIYVLSFDWWIGGFTPKEQKKLVSLAICWPSFYSLGNISLRKCHWICGSLKFTRRSVQMQRYPLEDFYWKCLHLQLLSSVCVIYHNLLILLHIIVIKLISNIISNFNTYICLSCMLNI